MFNGELTALVTAQAVVVVVVTGVDALRIHSAMVLCFGVLRRANGLDINNNLF